MSLMKIGGFWVHHTATRLAPFSMCTSITSLADFLTRFNAKIERKTSKNSDAGAVSTNMGNFAG